MGRKKVKKKTEASAETFKFAANDPIVIANLSATEINDVGSWQQSDEFVFEFHEGHEIGYPIYIRPVEGLKRNELNIPKINTKNNVNSPYQAIGNFENGEKLTANLTGAAQNELFQIVDDEWATLKLLAERYWTNTEPPVFNQVRPDMICGGCKGRWTGDHYFGDANEYGKYRCPKCKKYTLKPV